MRKFTIIDQWLKLLNEYIKFKIKSKLHVWMEIFKMFYYNQNHTRSN